MAELVVHERGDDRGAQAEDLAQGARDVVLAAAFPDLEAARGVDPPVARRRAVVVGGRRPGDVEILEGLVAGDRVVITLNGKFLPYKSW